jgi:adenylate cyclase
VPLLPGIAFGTGAYPEKIARRLRAVNIATWSIASATLFFAILRFLDPRPEMLPRALANLGATFVLALLPLLHRFGPLVAPLTLIGFIYGFLIYVVTQVGMDGGGWLAYLSAAALAMLLVGTERLWLCIALCAVAALIVICLQIYVPDNTGLLSDKSLFLGNFVFNILANMSLIFMIVYYAVGQIARAEAIAEREYRRSEELLENILPRDVAERLKRQPGKIIADRFDNASVLFLDLAGSTALASHLSPESLVSLLNEIFTRLDDMVQRFGLEKIKTTGDGYMVVSGVPSPNHCHAEVIADFALAIQHEFRNLTDHHGEPIPFRIGIESGPVVAGVVGTRKFFYDVWGDTVNVASRMESTCIAGKVQIGPSIATSLRKNFELMERGNIEVRGKGTMQTWFLTGRDKTGRIGRGDVR